MTTSKESTPKKKDTGPPTRPQPGHASRNPVLQTSVRKIRGYDALKPFLREVNKIVSEECSKHESVTGLSWFTQWSKWNEKSLFTVTSINTIGKIVCPELKYNERTVKQITNRIMSDITPLSAYLTISYCSDTSVKWDSIIEVGSYKSVKGHKSRKTNIEKLRTQSPFTKSRSRSRDTSTISSKISPPKEVMISDEERPSTPPPTKDTEENLTGDFVPPTPQVTNIKTPVTTLVEKTKLDDNAARELTQALLDATNRGTTAIGKAIATAKQTAVDDLNTEYNAILADLVKYDTTKDELERTTKAAIDELKLSQSSCDKTREAIEASNLKVKEDLAVTRQSMENTTIMNDNLTAAIAAATYEVSNLQITSDDVIRNIKTAATKERERVIGNTTSYLNSYNDKLLDKMETVFSENLQLMEEVKDEFDMETIVKTSIQRNLGSTFVEQIVDDVKKSTEVQDTSRDIIVKLVKR